MKRLIVILLFSLLISTVKADHPEGTIKVDIYGLVCDFCARALEKVFSKEDAVDGIAVDLDTKVVTIHLHPERSLSDNVIKQYIIDAGYNVEGIHRGS